MAKHNIMIVDDSVSIVRYLEEIINKKISCDGDFNVRATFSGEEALELAKIQSPDLLILDMSLPRLTGLQTCQIFKDLFPTLPIIMITADLSIENRQAAFHAGAVDFILKPFNSEQILTLIRTHIKELLDTD